jgi:hypothetical protein
MNLSIVGSRFRWKDLKFNRRGHIFERLDDLCVICKGGLPFLMLMPSLCIFRVPDCRKN